MPYQRCSFRKKPDNVFKDVSCVGKIPQSEGKPSLNKDFCTEGAGWGGDQNFSLELEYKVRSQNIKWKEHIVLNINKTQPVRS